MLIPPIHNILALRHEVSPRTSHVLGASSTIRDYAQAQQLCTEGLAVERRAADLPAIGWALKRLETEHDNLPAALQWAVRHDVETALRLAGQLWWFWNVRGCLSEGCDWLARALAKGKSVSPAVRALAFLGAGGLAVNQGDYAAARVLFEESLALHRGWGTSGSLPPYFTTSGLWSRISGTTQRRPLFEESLALKRELEDKRGIAFMLQNLTMVALEQGDYATAHMLGEKSLTLERQPGDKRSIAISLKNLGRIALEQGDYAAARALVEESLVLRRALGNKQGSAECLEGVACASGELAEPTRGRGSMEQRKPCGRASVAPPASRAQPL